MPRIKLVDGDAEPAREVLAEVTRERGQAYAVYRALANSPFVLEDLLRLITDFTRQSRLDERLRELLILRIAQVTRCDYVWGRHRGRSEASGLSADDRRALAGWRTAGAFSEAEGAALAAVECLATAARCPDDVLDEAQRHFTDEQMVEIVALAGLYGLIARVALNFDLELEPGDSGLDSDG